MKTLDELASRLHQVKLRLDPAKVDRVARLANEGFFHIPLVAFCILILSRSQKEKLHLGELAAWTGATLGAQFSSLETAHRKLEWSLNHRRRCADALVFLENVGLVQVGELDRTLRCTPKGLEILRDLMHRDDEIGVLSRGLDKSSRKVERHGLFVS
jgi:hypothetical protein